ncbi:efflux RND transporter periplasmic adaptor subunit [Azospirillum rugosum]|uniref:Multidrug efflux system membrane fusion protein n=1 Tax=Azospirillum rugosum TaxID=416170 RepID=A0ABS4STV0_9PROT|nr:efflux RND transporter periplasmic adaptor subunit [Azospirillum rugosum]MBP2295963.1 multidrug efflux system membrane fusion protein [Azospirillum rugosum]MDQ0529553.1 multidrug efflux system membrane fusion protein [Azospirillum rugosum]
MPLSRAKLAVLLVTGVSAVAVASVAPSFQGHADAPAAAAVPPPPEVDVAPVVARKVTDWQGYSGRLEAVDRVDVRPQVSGSITAVHFRNGAFVKKGDVLFTIDPRPYQAEVARAEAQVAAAQARVRFTAADLDRAQRLVKDSTISRQSMDQKENDAREAAANLKAAQAALDMAQINLGYTQVTAPVAGRVSRAEITVGNVVAAGAASAPLTTVVSVSPMYASFDVDEQTYLRHIAPARDSNNIPVQLGLANESGYSRDGAIEHVDNRLDVTSGTIRVRAKFDNADGMLVPGLYARVKVGSTVPRDALLVDERAIGTDQDKKFVLVVNAENRVEYREVGLGPLREGLRVVNRGLSAEDRVIVNGIQHARPGTPVQPHIVAMGDNPAQTKVTTASAAQ